MLYSRVVTTCIFLPALVLPLIFDWRMMWMLVMIPGCVILSVYELTTMLMRAPASMDHGHKATLAHPVRRVLSEWMWKSWLILSCLVIYVCMIMVTNHVAMVAVGVGAGLWLLVGNLFLAAHVTQGVHRLYVSVVSLVYGCLAWLSLWYVFQLGERGHEAMMFIIAVVMGSDTGGFIGGKLFGRRALAPQVSPNKTWEGALFAVLFASLIGGGYGLWVELAAPLHVLLMTVVGAVAAMLGDLIESVLKRYSGVKDSGSLFPGHGGFLDRADGFIVATPILWLLMKLFMG